MITENFWFEDEEIEWSFKLEDLKDVPKMIKDGIKIVGKSSQPFLLCIKKESSEKIVFLENIDAEIVEV
jgi:hypothetical protein